MALRCWRFGRVQLALVTLVAVCYMAITVPLQAQNVAAPADDSSANDNPYDSLRKSKDRTTQLTADRYHNLVRMQEWSSDKGTKITAKYVSHSPDLKSVKISVAKGYGAQRVMSDVTVPVERLSKTCQSRVKQISVLQKKLDELLKTDGTELTESGVPQPGAESAETAPEVRGAEQPTEPSESPSTRRPAAPIDDDGDSDPLGFSELPPNSVAGPPGAVAPSDPTVYDPGVGPRPVGDPQLPAGGFPGPTPTAENEPWLVDYNLFVGNIRVMEAQEGAIVDWSQMPKLKEAIDEVQKWEATGDVGEEEHQQIAKKFDAVGEVSWETTLTDADVSSGDWTDRLNLPPLPEPLSIGFILDDKKNPGAWQNLKAGDRVRFTGRFVDVENGSDLVMAIRFPALAKRPEVSRPAAGDER